jgi:hypothetical protein
MVLPKYAFGDAVSPQQSLSTAKMMGLPAKTDDGIAQQVQSMMT